MEGEAVRLLGFAGWKSTPRAVHPSRPCPSWSALKRVFEPGFQPVASRLFTARYFCRGHTGF